ncbi:MAG: CAP domain-containing protein [Rhodobacteraceae bacterium]|nr:CAP domain-containing protein [Paracoccaceae bacterium]
MPARATLPLALALLAALAAPAAAQGGGCDDVAGVARELDRLAAAINREREAEGLRALGLNAKVAEAARNHGCDMVERDYFSHTGRDGSSATTRLEAVGYRPCFTAENLAYGQEEPGQVVRDWMNSPGHRANILHRRARVLGAAAVRPAGRSGPVRWVVVFANPC